MRFINVVGWSMNFQDYTIDVLVIGRACVDYISVVDQFPAENTKVPLTMRLAEGGGQGATSSCCVARLGGRVVYIGRVGDDEEGRFCLKRLKDFRVDTSCVQVVKDEITPVAYVFITRDSGKRTIIFERSHMPPLIIDEPLEGLLKRARVLLMDPQVTYLAGQLKSLNTFPVIIYDCERFREGIEDMMKIADYFIPSSQIFHDRPEWIAGSSKTEKIMKLSGMVSGILVMTDGENGAYYVQDKKLYQVMPPEARIKDTTGAGDNFHAAFALAISRGFSLSDAVRLSVAVATLSCRDYGGRAGLPEFDEAVEVMKSLQLSRVAL
jgi:sulfofructose kinase